MATRDVVRKTQDLTNISWSERVSSSGTAGTYLKARTGESTRMLYYKLARFNGLEIDGHECVNEIIASRLMDILGIEHLPYRLIHARISIAGREYDTWLNSSRNFRSRGERKIAFGAFFDLYCQAGETPFGLCQRFGWAEQIKQMMLVDYLMVNRDRHSSNVEVLVAPNGTRRLSPIFDTGFSLLAPYAGDVERALRFDPLAPVATNNFIGSRSLEENLLECAPVTGVSPLKESDKEILLNGLQEALDPRLLEKSWQIIWERWQHYANL